MSVIGHFKTLYLINYRVDCNNLPVGDYASEFSAGTPTVCPIIAVS